VRTGNLPCRSRPSRGRAFVASVTYIELSSDTTPCGYERRELNRSHLYCITPAEL